MNASNRNLLAMALATLLLSPAVWAGKGAGQQDAVPPDKTMGDKSKQGTERTDQAPPPAPTQSQGAEHATDHSSVAQRDLWTRLDSNGDGRISATEGAVDSGFDSGFGAMDADKDGFVTDTEYRASAKTDLDAAAATGGVNASSQSTTAMRDTMARLDTNADGSVSLSEGEADATFKSNFAAIDANSDGIVTDSEYRAWTKAERK